MRTKLLPTSLKRISSINRQLTHAFFIGEQFLIDNSDILVHNSEIFTGMAFSTNTHKEKFNYRLGEVNNIYTEYQEFLLISSFVFLYSIFNQYQKDLFSLTEKLRTTKYVKLEKTPIIESLFIGLGSTIKSNLDQEEIDTLNYIRLRRNCIIHAEGNPNDELLKLANKSGKKLTTYWQSVLGIGSMDFSSNAIEQFSENELLEIIRIIRHLMSKMDEQILNLIGKSEIISSGLSEFRKIFVDKIHSRDKKRLKTMFSSFILREYGIERTELDFSTIIF
jgi:hypothetical protein